MKNDYPSRWVRAGKYEHIAGMTAEAVSIARRKGKLVDGKQVMRAHWIPRLTVEVTSDDFFEEGMEEYDPATDAYYCPQGWYERNLVGEANWSLEGITHWMPLPALPPDTVTLKGAENE